MRAVANVLNPNITPYIVLSHDKEEPISFTISTFGRESFKNENEGSLDCINQYWAQLPEERQRKIFEIYKAIDYGNETIFNEEDLITHIADRVAELIYEHNLDEVRHWIYNKSNIRIPESEFRKDYQHSFDNNTTREKTYTLGDYVSLISLSVLLRCMIPVWGDYIAQNRKRLGTKFKEFSAFQLLNKSNLNNSVPVQKLRQYVEGMVGNDRFNPDNIHNGITSEDYCEFLVAMICVKRLCTGNISWNPESPRNHLASMLYTYVIRQIQGGDSNSETSIREKKDTDEKGTNGFSDKISTLEKYKFKFTISPGEIAELEVAMSDVRQNAEKLCFRVDKAMLERSLYSSQILAHERLFPPQINLMRWIFARIISPRGMMYLPTHIVVEAIGATEAMLWSMGYKHLSIISSCYPMVEESAAIMRVSNIDSRSLIPDELVAKLNMLFPFSRTEKAKKNDQGDTVIVNPGMKSINDMFDSLRLTSWRASCHEDMLQEVYGNTNRRIAIRPEVKLELAKLVVDLAERNW